VRRRDVVGRSVKGSVSGQSGHNDGSGAGAVPLMLEIVLSPCASARGGSVVEKVAEGVGGQQPKSEAWAVIPGPDSGYKMGGTE